MQSAVNRLGLVRTLVSLIGLFLIGCGAAPPAAAPGAPAGNSSNLSTAQPTRGTSGGIQVGPTPVATCPTPQPTRGTGGGIQVGPTPVATSLACAPPTSNAGPPQHVVGELRYTENYNSTTTIGPRSSHTVEGSMQLKLKLDPEQSDESKTVWVDDGGQWELKGTGQQKDAPCTDVKETYSGSGTFQNWNPSVEGTGIVQVTVFNEPANQPPLLTFSVVGHIVSAGTSGNGGGCRPFNAANWWPFPTSMAGSMLQGVADRSGGTLHITFTLMSDPNKPDAFSDVAGGFVEGRP